MATALPSTGTGFSRIHLSGALRLKWGTLFRFCGYRLLLRHIVFDGLLPRLDFFTGGLEIDRIVIINSAEQSDSRRSSQILRALSISMSYIRIHRVLVARSALIPGVKMKVYQTPQTWGEGALESRTSARGSRLQSCQLSGTSEDRVSALSLVVATRIREEISGNATVVLFALMDMLHVCGMWLPWRRTQGLSNRTSRNP